MSTILHILQHALGRDKHGKNPDGRPDYRNHFCAGEGSADFTLCREAVTLSLMREHPPREISGGDHIFVVTDAGKAYIAEHGPPEPARTRGQERYHQFLQADPGLSFGEWLRGQP